MPGAATDRNREKRVLFAGGGTGGHVFMAVAIARSLRDRDPDVAIRFVGTPGGLENRILPSLGIDLDTLEIGKLKRVGLMKVVSTVLQLPGSLWKARRILRSFSPSVVVGLGGYSSGPVVLVAAWTGVPSLLIEPNSHPGLTNRLLARWVDRAAVAFQESGRWFGSKARLTGIPVRKEFYEIEEVRVSPGPLRVLVFGGSQGSQAINTLVCEALPFLSPESVRLTHQTGPADYSRVKQCYDSQSFPGEIVPFINTMPGYFKHADLIVSRAGASTVAEIAAAGRPSILIPFPYATDDHQRKNALALKSQNAALVLEQDTVSGEELAEMLSSLAAERELLCGMSGASRELSRPDSVDRINQVIDELVTGSENTGPQGRNDRRN